MFDKSQQFWTDCFRANGKKSISLQSRFESGLPFSAQSILHWFGFFRCFWMFGQHGQMFCMPIQMKKNRSKLVPNALCCPVSFEDEAINEGKSTLWIQFIQLNVCIFPLNICKSRLFWLRLLHLSFFCAVYDLPNVKYQMTSTLFTKQFLYNWILLPLSLFPALSVSDIRMSIKIFSLNRSHFHSSVYYTHT